MIVALAVSLWWLPSHQTVLLFVSLGQAIQQAAHIFRSRLCKKGDLQTTIDKVFFIFPDREEVIKSGMSWNKKSHPKRSPAFFFLQTKRKISRGLVFYHQVAQAEKILSLIVLKTTLCCFFSPKKYRRCRSSCLLGSHSKLELGCLLDDSLVKEIT